MSAEASAGVDARAIQSSGGPRAGWLFGPGSDLLIGCGLAYILLMPVLFWVAGNTGATAWPAIAVAVMVLLANSPHYGATIVRVYEARQDRRKYAVFAVYLTIALALMLFASTRSVWLCSLLITAYVTWSPWHFSGQNYGLALMFLRRRRVEVDPATKRLLYASFVLSAVLAILAIHSGHDDMVFAPYTIHVANAPTVLHLPLPAGLVKVALLPVALAYLGCLVAAGWRLRGRAPLREFVPSAVLVATQALWFTVPAVLLDWDQARGSTLIFAAVWISTAHSIQYLWVTAYYARSSESSTPVARFLLKSFLAGTAVVVLPGVVLAPELLGRLPWDAGMAATIFAVVNLHHFVLDGAIWKLRDGRVARVLLRSSEPPALPEPIDSRRQAPWLRSLVWAVAALAVPIQLAQIYANRTLQTGDDAEGARRILRWIGREGLVAQFESSQRRAAAGDHAGAAEQLRHSIEQFPTARAWGALGAQYQALGRWDLALDAFDEAIALNPGFWGAHQRRAETLLALDPSLDDPATSAEATASLERALKLRPGFARAALMLADLQAETIGREEAVRTLQRILAEAHGADAQVLRTRLAELRPTGG